MRGSRPTPKDNKTSPGNALRDALARKQEADAERAQDDAAQKQSALELGLSKWFNDVAAQLPAVVSDLTKALEAGRNVATDMSFAPPDGVSVRGVTGVDVAALSGFKSLDQACRDLDIECTVTSGRHGYGRRSTAGQEYLHLNIDTAKPYKPMTVETPKPHGPGRYR